VHFTLEQHPTPNLTQKTRSADFSPQSEKARSADFSPQSEKARSADFSPQSEKARSADFSPHISKSEMQPLAVGCKWVGYLATAVN